MSCGPEPVTFRLLDAHASWKLDLAPKSAAVAIDTTIHLAQLDPAAIDPNGLSAAMPPPWVARGCCACEWFLACCPTVLRYAPAGTTCDASCFGWVVVAGEGCRIELVDPVAVAAQRGRVAILDRGRRAVLVLTSSGERVIAEIPTAATGPLAFWATQLVVADGESLVAFDLVTLEAAPLPDAPGPIVRMVVADHTLWIATETATGELELYRLVEGEFIAATEAELLAVAPKTGIAAASDDAVCLEIPRGDNEPRRMCIDRCGRPASEPPPTPGPALATKGEVTTAPQPLDSGIARCSWHRVRIELDLPARTSVTIRLATTEEPADEIAAEDWQVVDDRTALSDFLVDQPPGRYLHLRICLRGDGLATPTIRRIRIDFPRSTSAMHLPGVFREDPIAAEFLDRFVSLFDASIGDLDRVIERFPALLDPASTPQEGLAWVATFLDIVLDPAWSEATRRNILLAAPELYRMRGTASALARAIEITTGVAPAIQEMTGQYARVARPGDPRGFRLGDARLFGAARARVRLAATALGSAPLRSYGDPDLDYLAATGWRVLVQVPGSAAADPDALARLRRLVDAQKPAHVVAQLRVGGGLPLVGTLAVGIDTALGGLPPSYLGISTRLRRMTALARGKRHGSGLAVGTASAIGLQTVLS